jgi:uncharacterized protein (TIGR00290 family)
VTDQNSTPLPAFPEPVLMCWSGGKDSSLALHAVMQDPALNVVSLLTCVTEEYERVSMHGVRVELLKRQSAECGTALTQTRIPPKASNEIYEAAMERALKPWRERGVKRCVFGDLFLADLRKYREEKLAKTGMSALFPLWMKDTKKLAAEFIAQGFRAILVSVDPRRIDPKFCGREFDQRLLDELPPSCDPCGENGEFHTFVYAGPVYKRPIPVKRGQVVEREGFWFCDLLPE